MKTKIKTIILCISVAIVAIVSTAVVVKKMCTPPKTILQLDVSKSYEEVKNLVVKNLADEADGLCEVCLTDYRKDVKSPYGRDAHLPVSRKAAMCVKSVMSGANDVFKKCKERSMSEIGRVCNCFVKKDEIEGTLGKIESYVNTVIQDERLRNSYLSEIEKRLRDEIVAEHESRNGEIKKKMINDGTLKPASGDNVAATKNKMSDFEKLISGAIELAGKTAINYFI